MIQVKNMSCNSNNSPIILIDENKFKSNKILTDKCIFFFTFLNLINALRIITNHNQNIM